jgi:predicted ATPase/class 3 adenylate cyclase
MRCPSCRATNPGRARFCQECGLRLPVGTGTGRAAPEAERRQMTFLFCDIKDSVPLSVRIDPEELRNILADYQRVCHTVAGRFEGKIARYEGDGIMYYFGYPFAHEDEAQRGVRSGLAIMEGIAQLNLRLERERGMRVQVRIGVHTGLVVAGDIATDPELERDAAIGAPPNIASRLQDQAAPDSMVISSATYNLIAGYFHCQDLGFVTLRGISKPMAIYQVLNESSARTRLDVAAIRGLPPMEGRDAELGLLTKLWREACASNGRAALVIGEPGIGKSRLVWALEEHVAQALDASLTKWSCSPYFQNTAFYPVIEYLERALEFDADDTANQRLDKLDGFLAQYGFPLPDFAPLVADLLSLPYEGRYVAPNVPADRRRQVLIDAIVRTVLLRAAHQPLLLIVEDLHWADPSTLDVLTQLIECAQSARLMVVLSSRPEFIPAWPVEHLTLGRLETGASRSIVNAVSGKELPAEIIGQLIDKADGVPLYLEELTKLVLDEVSFRVESGRSELAGPLPELTIPPTLADSLTARLDQQSSAKRIAQLGATIGRQFSYELLVSVLRAMGPVNTRKVRQDLTRLVGAGLLLVKRDGRETYTFKHALIQDSAYGMLLRSTRQQYHGRIAQALADASPSSTEVAPELLAHHFAQAGLIAEAMPWWLRAGQRALRGSAYKEAIAHLERGLELVADLPESAARISQELEFRLTLGPAYMATRGYGAAEVQECYHRARELCQQLGNPPQLAPVVYGLWSYHIVRAQHWTALELGQQILDLGVANHDLGLQVQGNLALGWSQFFLGRFSASREHLERVLELYDHDRQSSHAYQFGDDPGTSASSCLAQVYWLCGYPDKARRQSDDALHVLRSLSHPYSVAFGLVVNGFVRLNLGDAATTRALQEEAIALSREHGLPLTATMGSMLHGYALTQLDELEAGIAEMREALAGYVATGAELDMPYWYWLLAEASHRVGATEDGIAYLDRAQKMLERTGERYFEAEIHRLLGQLLPEVAPRERTLTPEKCLMRALEVAGETGSKSLELRAIMALVRHDMQRGRQAREGGLLRTTYDWFTEGFETPDLREARRLLGELDSPEYSRQTAITGTT